MAPERESGDTARDTVLDPEGLAREAAEVMEVIEAAGAVPAPRPEVLARVLEGLRHLPAVARDAATSEDAEPGGERVLPLPRRHP